LIAGDAYAQPVDRNRRIAALRAVMADEDLPALLITSLANLRYLTGFTGSAGRLLVTPERLLFMTDGRYEIQAAEQLGAAGVDAELFVPSPSEAASAAADVLGATLEGSACLGVEARSLTWAEARSVEESVQAEIVPTNGLVEGLRARKEPDEIDLIAAAVALADASLADVLSAVTPDTTEVQLALDLEWTMRTRGAEGTSFDPIVAAGPRGALPHARPSTSRIGAGVPVVIDFGCVVEGYCSDTTRTVCWGEVAAPVDEIHAVVAAAQDAARAAVRAGVRAQTVDAAARAVIEEAGWGEYFVHGTGHGVGLEVHELPRLGPASTDVLAAGNVVTIEPGVYVPGLCGVRIEDMVVVTEQGCDTLTAASRTLMISA
jgi:Xaa-Pro aminopeptidase